MHAYPAAKTFKQQQVAGTMLMFEVQERTTVVWDMLCSATRAHQYAVKLD